jgi:aspartate/methionine/tyrosine aminotransferase
LVGLIRHPATNEALEAARTAYADRRRAVSVVLAAHGVDTTGTDGINLWMRVADERAAVVALAAQGIGVAPGTPFLLRPDTDHLRVTVGLLSPARGLDRVAGQLAAAAVLGGPGRRRTPTPHR